MSLDRVFSDAICDDGGGDDGMDVHGRRDEKLWDAQPQQDLRLRV